MPYKGIDVSSHNGIIDWEKAVSDIEFAIIRAGYGKNNIDPQFKRNVNECQRLYIPFGAYWFSYAYTTDMAVKEADYLCNAMSGYKPTYPLCFDFEYDSAAWAEKNGVNVTADLLINIAKAFLNRVEERGYFAVNYTNVDYLNKGFSKLTNRYALWLAQWGVKEPTRSCAIWQSTSAGKVSGIKTNVDINTSYVDFPKIISSMGKSEATIKEYDKEKELKDYKEKMWETYYHLAKEVLDGKYGTGDNRKKALQNLGYDYNSVQAIVNILVK